MLQTSVAKRGSCGWSLKSICLRSHQTTPPLLTPRNQDEDFLAERRMLMFSLVLHLKPTTTGREKRKGTKLKAILEIHSLRRDTTSARVIKYLLGLFGHCTLLILDRKAFCHKPYYGDSEQEENLTNKCRRGERNLQPHVGSIRLAIDLAEHDVLCACQGEMGLH